MQRDTDKVLHSRYPIFILCNCSVLSECCLAQVPKNVAKGDKDKMFWIASPEKAALQIYDSVKRKKNKVYVSKRWRIIAWFLKIHSLSN